MISSSVSDLEDQPAPLPGAAGAHDRAERASNPTLAADHLADVVLGDMQPEHHGVITHLLLDPDRAGVVDETLCKVGQELSQDS